VARPVSEEKDKADQSLPLLAASFFQR